MTYAMKFDASLLCQASFPAELEDDGGRCTVEVTVYRLNAVAVNTFLLDGPEPLRRHLGSQRPTPTSPSTTSTTSSRSSASSERRHQHGSIERDRPRCRQ